ncbi:MAG: arginine N-succinyltransferase, partial [Candidatus Omnitrophica bacterium]|nr:arginine N-succinyltransferase [Candidatus Omnitrophota bacterium]
PRFPIYLALLPKEAQEVIGQVHPETVPALHFLEEEGFIHKGEIDIFEAGPVMKAKLKNIRTIRESRRIVVEEIVEHLNSEGQYLVATVGAFQDFRCTIGPLIESHVGVKIPREMAKILKLQIGSQIHVSPVKGKKKGTS